VNRQVFDECLGQLLNAKFLHILGGGKFVKGTRKLVDNIYSEKELDLHQRIVYYVVDITRYVVRDLSNGYEIQSKAIMYAEKIKNHSTFEGKEPLRIAAVLVFLAGRNYHLSKFKQYISYLTGVSQSYISTNYLGYEDEINNKI
jgi:transcription initiation factor TFIIIB Brf1 subunit/transcription initiation factor TFIIB